MDFGLTMLKMRVIYDPHRSVEEIRYLRERGGNLLPVTPRIRFLDRLILFMNDILTGVDGRDR